MEPFSWTVQNFVATIIIKLGVSAMSENIYVLQEVDSRTVAKAFGD
jgi:hypothetical protein